MGVGEPGRQRGSGSLLRRDVALSVVAAFLVVCFSVLCWWQVRRATSGNTLSWAYVFEWPLFAGYVLYMWWRLTREPRRSGPAAGDAPEEPGGRAKAAGAPGGDRAHRDDEEEELAAYNAYLAALEGSGRKKRW